MAQRRIIVAVIVVLAGHATNQSMRSVSHDAVELDNETSMPAATQENVTASRGPVQGFLKTTTRPDFAELNNVSLVQNASDHCTAILEDAAQGQICRLPGATQMPFYMQAVQSIISVLLNHFAFKPTDRSQPATLFNHIVSMLVCASFASRIYQDASNGPEAFVIGWVVAASGAFAAIAYWKRSATSCGNLMMGVILGTLTAVAAFLLLFFYFGYNDMSGFSCSLVRWTRGADQLPTLISVMALMTTEDLHESRKWHFRMMFLLAVIYAPPLNVVGPVLVLSGSAVFIFLPFALWVSWLAILAGTYLCLRGNPAQAIEEPLVQDQRLVQDREAAVSWLQLSLKMILVPTIIYIQFVGEAMTRYIDGEGWSGSLHNTWAARTAPQYFCHFLTSDAATQVLEFLGLL